jgi:hypothetical protein
MSDSTTAAQAALGCRVTAAVPASLQPPALGPELANLQA